MSVYDKTGGDGKTSLLNGNTVSKNSAQIHFEGAADELNSRLGLVKAMITDNVVQDFLEDIQKTLMIIMAHVSDPLNAQYYLPKNKITVLEKEIDRLSQKLPKELQFIIPGKNILEAQIHIARTAARTAERMYVAIIEQQESLSGALCENALSYLNKLSGYLFFLSQSV